MADKQRLCFVIGPIGKDHSPERKHADMMLHSVIEPILRAEPFGYEVRRADKAEDPGMVLNDIIKGLLEAPLVVADLSFQNPNVFWELGIRHAATKPVICLAAVGTDIPFDAQGHRVILVDLADWDSQETARGRLKTYAAEVDKKGFTVSNPITQAKGYIEMSESADPKETLVADLEARVSRVERVAMRLDHQARNRSIHRRYDTLSSMAEVAARRANLNADILLLEQLLSERGKNNDERLQILERMSVLRGELDQLETELRSDES